jgi:hypothetical protein
MFFEWCGRFFFSRMRPFFLLFFSLAPILAATLFLFVKNMQIDALEERFEMAARKEKLAFERRQKKEKFLQQYADSDPYFVNRQIESLSFLQKEKSLLESLLYHPASIDKQPLQERLLFIESGENKLSFVEENIRSSKEIKETEEKQRHPVQMEEEDLQRILSLLENVAIGSYLPTVQNPQILIRDFRMKKIKNPMQTESFEVEMELLKREFIKP